MNEISHHHELTQSNLSGRTETDSGQRRNRTSYWRPMCLFDQEPNWKGLGLLPPDTCLIGQQHRNGKLWYLDLKFDDLPPEYRNLQLFDFPCDFDIPEGVSLSPACLEFIAKAGAVGDIAGMFPAGVLRLGATVSALAGVRTLVIHDPFDTAGVSIDGRQSAISSESSPGFDLACLFDGAEVVAFGVACGSGEIIWENGIVRLKCGFDPNLNAETVASEVPKRLAKLPYLRLEFDPALCECERESNYWPKRLWPVEWGDFEEILGIGPAKNPLTSGWKDCHYRASRNTPGFWGSLFEIIFRRPFSTTKIGKFFRPHRHGESSDEGG